MRFYLLTNPEAAASAAEFLDEKVFERAQEGLLRDLEKIRGGKV